MESINRRKFLKGSLGAATAFTVMSKNAIMGSSSKVILGIMGVGGRGRALLSSMVKRTDVTIKYICDADRRSYGPAAEIVMEGHDYKPKYVQDYLDIAKQLWHHFQAKNLEESTCHSELAAIVKLYKDIILGGFYLLLAFVLHI